jgi:uncharacterized protein (DUF1501 family)
MMKRRTALLGLAATVTLGRASLALAAAPTERRFVVVLLRGALDGLSAVVPYGDAGLAALRGPLLAPPPGQDGGLLDLGGFFGLHPALAGLHGLYQAGDLLPVHAVAGFWRSRSHFEAQDFLEFGTAHGMSCGWLNRVAALLPLPAATEAAIAIADTPPPLLRGPATVGSWMPPRFATPPPDLYARLAELHRTDPLTGPAIAEGLRARAFTAAVLAGLPAEPNRFGFPALAHAAGRLLAAADGPRLAALEIGDWDTHTAQLARLGGPLRQLDLGLTALRTGLGAAWPDTVVLVVTEFGRTVRVNGTGGTDHGTGTVAFVLGGRVAGGRVLADWPGLAPGALFENRDLQPTRDLRTLAAGLLAEHLGLDAAALALVFPEGTPAPPLSGLLRA